MEGGRSQHDPPRPCLEPFALGPGGPLASGIDVFHLIVWKFILISFTQVDLARARFLPDEIWKGAVRRLISRVERLKVVVRTRVLLAEGRGEQPSKAKDNELLAPLGAPLKRPVCISNVYR